MDLSNGTIVATDECVTDLALRETSLRLNPPGTVVVAMYGGFAQIGRTGLLGIPAAVNQALTAIHCASGVIDPEFLLAVLNHNIEHWRSVASSSRKDPNITRKDVFDFVIPLPPPAEQRAIAAALGDFDALIEALTELIAKKRDVMQATMEALLSGRRRLPGFTRDWAETTLGELFVFKNGLNKGKAFFGHGSPIINYMDVYRSGSVRADQITGKVAVSQDERKAFEVRRGDVLFTRTSETVEEIGLAACVLDDVQGAVFSGFLLRGRTVDARLDHLFKAYCLRRRSIRAQIVATASYTTRALTNGRLLSAVRTSLPPLPEQTAIAEVLTDMDTELAALEARLDKTRQLKRGMMQQLLTGRIRLV